MNFLKIVNWPLFLFSVLLISIGILVIYSSSPQLAFQQALFGSIGLLFFLFISQLDLHFFKRFMKPLYIFILTLLVIVYFLDIETRGSSRWIPFFFFNIQPSEFAKPILILQLGYFWSTNLPTWKNIFKSMAFVFPIIFLIFKQPDLGSALSVLSIWVGMLFVARLSFKKVLVLVLIAVIILPSSWIFLHDYQRQRVIGFLQPELDPLGRGYNAIQSTIAVGSGQLIGLGLGRGTQSRLQFLPEFRTDFIFASIAEEMGFFGSLIILTLYLLLLTYCLKIASNSEDNLYSLLIIGVFSMLLFQVFINIGMNIGLLPITGITLPFISYGGSSVIATYICLGIVASAAKNKGIIDHD